MNRPPAVECEALSKRHSGEFTLWIESLTVRAGEWFCLVGPVGSGKSTLLRLLSGLDLPSSGRLSLQRQSVASSSVSLDLLRQAATVPQKPLLLAESVRYNVEYGLRVRGDGLARSRADAVLESLGLTRMAGQQARTLSGGQAQLVAIARALVLEPRLLLLDEPTAHLDPTHVAIVERVIREQWERTGMTLVWATHNMFQARRLATRVGFMLDGRLIEVAATEAFFESPLDSRTLQFVQGKMVC